MTDHDELPEAFIASLKTHPNRVIAGLATEYANTAVNIQRMETEAAAWRRMSDERWNQHVEQMLLEFGQVPDPRDIQAKKCEGAAEHLARRCEEIAEILVMLKGRKP